MSNGINFAVLMIMTKYKTLMIMKLVERRVKEIKRRSRKAKRSKKVMIRRLKKVKKWLMAAKKTPLKIQKRRQ